MDNNLVDLTEGLEHENNSVDLLADKIFSIAYDDLDRNNYRIMMQNDLRVEDMFFMYMEILLYGVNRLTQGATIFDLQESTDEIVYVLKKYFKVIGIELHVHEVHIDNVNEYRRSTEVFCELFSPPPENISPFLRENLVQGYRVRLGNHYTNKNSLKDMFAIFLSKKRKLFNFSFSFLLS